MFDTPHSALPNGPGVGYKPQHFAAIMADAGPVQWLEIHAENYMGDGGRPLAQLRHLAERFPISLHGVGLSIGGEGGLDADHLARLRHLCDWLHPASFSEHLAWSTHDGAYLNDLLPLPYTPATLARVCAHVDQVQAALGRRMLLENPSTYLAFAEPQMAEVEFLAEIARRTGCGLLLDVNNVHVSAVNQGTSAAEYLAAFPLHLVGEIHLGGHEADVGDHGAPLLIDSHSAAVADPVWALYEAVIARGGARPTLIEWDNDVPDWPMLAAEAALAARGSARGGVMQSAFAAAVLDPDLAVPDGLVDPQGRPAPLRFAVYRNNVAASLTKVLEAGFPVVRALVGDQFFAAMAGVFLRAHPPVSRIMMLYGDAFPGFLAGFPPVAHLGYLPDVARLDLAMRQSYHAADAMPILPEVLTPDRLLTGRLTFAPALRLVQSEWPIYAIWAAHLRGGPPPTMQAQSVLILRPEFDPEPHLLGPAAPVMAALLAGQSLPAALDVAGDGFDLAGLLALLLGAGAITGMDE